MSDPRDNAPLPPSYLWIPRIGLGARVLTLFGVAAAALTAPPVVVLGFLAGAGALASGSLLASLVRGTFPYESDSNFINFGLVALGTFMAISLLGPAGLGVAALMGKIFLGSSLLAGGFLLQDTFAKTALQSKWKNSPDGIRTRTNVRNRTLLALGAAAPLLAGFGVPLAVAASVSGLFLAAGTLLTVGTSIKRSNDSERRVGVRGLDTYDILMTGMLVTSAAFLAVALLGPAGLVAAGTIGTAITMGAKAAAVATGAYLAVNTAQKIGRHVRMSAANARASASLR